MAQWTVIEKTGHGGCGTARLIETPRGGRYWLCTRLKGDRSTLVVRPDPKTGPCGTCRHNAALSREAVDALKAQGRELVQAHARRMAACGVYDRDLEIARGHLRAQLAKGGGVDLARPEVRELIDEMLLAAVDRGLSAADAVRLRDEEGVGAAR